MVRLRMVFIIILLSSHGGASDRMGVVVHLKGQVDLMRKNKKHAIVKEISLEAGDLVSTRRHGQMTLSFGDTTVEIAPGSTVVVEKPGVKFPVVFVKAGHVRVKSKGRAQVKVPNGLISASFKSSTHDFYVHVTDSQREFSDQIASRPLILTVKRPVGTRNDQENIFTQVSALEGTIHVKPARSPYVILKNNETMRIRGPEGDPIPFRTSPAEIRAVARNFWQ